MGQKINPVGFRLSVLRNWSSRWYANTKNFPGMLKEDIKVRDFLKVRRKDTCPRCGSKIRTAGVKGMDAYFCPVCQPATRASFVDWTRTGK